MHIGFVTPEYVTEANFDGGLANYLYRTAVTLAERGHEVEVFVSASLEAEEAFEQDGVVVRRVAGPRSLWARVWPRFPRVLRMDLLRNLLEDSWLHSRAVRARHKVRPFDIVQSTNVGLAGVFLSRRCPFPLVTRVSCHDRTWHKAHGWPRAFQRSAFEGLAVASARRSDLVYAPSRRVAKIWEEDENVPCEVCPSPVWLNNELPARPTSSDTMPRGRYILFFGSIGRLKGVDILAKALPQVLGKHPDVTVALVGKDTFYQGSSMVGQVVQRLGLYRWRLHYGGVLTRDELYPVIAGATVVVLPSRIDNLPNTCLEAMALGRVVVGSTNASFEELIEDGKSGFLFKNGDYGALAGVLDHVLALPASDTHRIGEAARRSMERLSPDNVLPKLEDLFAKAIVASGRRRNGT